MCLRHTFLKEVNKISGVKYIPSQQCFGLDTKELLNPWKTLYGLPDASDYWQDTIYHHLLEEMKMETFYRDISAYTKFYKYVNLSTLIGFYVGH